MVRYGYTIPAGETDAGATAITATADTPAFIAEGYASVEQYGGVLRVARHRATTHAGSSSRYGDTPSTRP